MGRIQLVGGNLVRENTLILDNVTCVLTDIHTGEKRTFSTHNTPLNHHFSAIASWVSGLYSNIGYNNVPPPSQIQYGNGSGTPSVSDSGCFSAISGSLTNLSYAQVNTPQNGTTTLVFQTEAGVITGEVTEAFLRDTSGNGFAHAMFGTPFTPSPTENITTQWELTYSG